MSAKILYRIAALIFLLFAVGHTVGFLRFRPPTAEGLAVWDGMLKVHFTVGGSTYSYGGFYIGFGLFVTVFQLFSAFVAWHLGMLSVRMPRAIGALGWTFCGMQVVNLVLAVMYFSGAPAVLSAGLVVCLGWAAVVAQRTASPTAAATAP